jgi:hypothetical protein
MAGVTPTSNDATFVTTNHTYASAKAYTVKATLRFQANNGADAQGKSTSVVCQTTFTIPSVTPAVTTTPSAPVELPKTGIAGVAGLFGGASVLGTLGYRMRASRKLNRVDDLINSLKR